MFFTLLALVEVAPLPCIAASVDRELDGIKSKIAKEKRSISQVQKREGSILQSLGKIEGELEKKTKELQVAKARLDAILAEQRNNEMEAERLRASLRQRKSLLEKRAEGLYRWHRSGSPLVILNGAVSSSTFLRRRRYLETTVAFDRGLVEGLMAEAALNEMLKQQLARQKEQLDEQRRSLADVKGSVQKEAEKKREILASLRKEKEARVLALKELEQAAIRLHRMMDEISKRSVRKPQEPSPGSGLETMRGKLDWPVKGEVIGGFGKSQHREFSAELFRKGIDIEAQMGDEIRAVENGKIVFADRFSGYGKMLIIDHGERYYTIYAHLSEFLRKNGDRVKRGEPIARAGDSESLAGAKLYFEMRKDGKSIDPLPWLRR